MKIYMVEQYYLIMKHSSETRNYNVGKSDYAKHTIQPWDIWLEYNLNPWDADIVKRVLRTKEGEERSLDYEKIIHICKERIRQLAEEAEDAPEPKCKPKTKCEDEDDEEDEHTVRVHCENHKPPMISYPYAAKPIGPKYYVYGVFETYGTWYAYLGCINGDNVYLSLSGTPGIWTLTEYEGFPKYTFNLGKSVLGQKEARTFVAGYEISLKIGGYGTDYEIGDYIINNGLLYRYLGAIKTLNKSVYENKHKYIQMIGIGCFEEFFTTEKIKNDAVQQVIKGL